MREPVHDQIAWLSARLGGARGALSAGLALRPRWAYVLAALLVGVLVASLAQGLAAGPQVYPDLVVGDLAWKASAKQQDYAALGGVLFGAALALPALLTLAGWVGRRGGGEALHHPLAMATLPACIWLGGSVLGKGNEVALLQLAGVLVLVVGLGAALAFRHEQTDAEQVGRMLCYGLVVVVAAALLPVAVGLLFGRAAPWLGLRHPEVKPWTSWPMVDGFIAAAGLFVLALWRTPARVEARLRAALLVLQVLLLPLYLAIIALPWNRDRDLAVSCRPTWVCWLFVGLLVGAALVDLARRAHRERRLAHVISPFAALAVLALARTQDVGQPLLPTDDYHLGESLLPAWSWIEHGLVPYVDYSPVRGLQNYVPGLLSRVFFDGSAASFGAVEPVTALCYALVTLLALAPVLGVLPALVALLLMGPAWGVAGIDMIMTAVLVTLARTHEGWPPARWLVLWLTLGVAAVLFAPGQGALIVLATAPLGAVSLRAAWRAERRALVRAAVTVAVAGLLLALLTPLGKMLVGAVRYGAEQSSLNDVANGIAWTAARGWFKDLITFSWIAVGIAAAWRAMAGMDAAAPERRQILRVTVPVLLLSGLYVIRAAGRIDPDLASRPAQASIWMTCLLAPLLVTLARTTARRDLLMVAVVAAGAALTPVFEPLKVEAMLQRPRATVNPDQRAIVGRAFGLGPIGTTRMNTDQLGRLRSIKAVLGRTLDPGETYLDGSNRNAHYFYLDLPPPIESGALYNLVHHNQQLRSLRRLLAHPPPVAVVDADNIKHDGGTAATRTYPLYRYLVKHYLPAEVEGRIYLARPDRLFRLVGSNVRPDVTDGARERMLDRVFLVPDLRSIPRSWGASLPSLLPRLRPVAALGFSAGRDLTAAGPGVFTARGGSPTLVFDVGKLALAGESAGLLRVSLTCLDEAAHPGPLVVSWTGDGGARTGRVIFEAGDAVKTETEYLVPLDAQPRWLAARHIDTLTLEAAFPNHCPHVSVGGATLYQRRVVDEMKELGAETWVQVPTP